jgi:hypothetical protein
MWPTLVASDNQPEGLPAASQGNAQTTFDRNLVVGWGAVPYFSEFDPWGHLVFNAQFPAGVNTYRAYLLPWGPQVSAGVTGSSTRHHLEVSFMTFDSAVFNPHRPLPVGSVIDVRTRYLGQWSPGFQIAEKVGGGCRIRRSSDGSVLADIFQWSGVRPATASRYAA